MVADLLTPTIKRFIQTVKSSHQETGCLFSKVGSQKDQCRISWPRQARRAGPDPSFFRPDDECGTINPIQRRAGMRPESGRSGWGNLDRRRKLHGPRQSRIGARGGLHQLIIRRIFRGRRLDGPSVTAMPGRPDDAGLIRNGCRQRESPLVGSCNSNPPKTGPFQTVRERHSDNSVTHQFFSSTRLNPAPSHPGRGRRRRQQASLS